MKQLDLSKDNVNTLYKRYLVPTICATMITSAYVIADTIMIGHGIGKNALIALNLLLPMFSLQFGIGNMFGIGGGVLASVAQGAGDRKRVSEIFSTAIASITVISVLMSLFMTIFAEKICYLLGAGENTIDYALSYARILFLCTPALIFSSCLQGFIRNDKDPNRAMVAVFTGSGLNIVLDYIFIYIFHMGMSGAILATILGAVVNTAITVTHFMKKDNSLVFSIKAVRISTLGNIVLSGATSFLVEMTSGITMFFFNIQILKYIGDVGVVVYSVLTNTAIVCASLINGSSQAIQPIVAHNYGSGSMDRVKKVRRIGFVVLMAITCCVTLYANMFPDTLIEAFVKPDAEIYRMGRRAIHIYYLCFIPTAVNVYLSNYFQATIRAKKAFVITFARGIIFSVAFVLMFPMMFGGESIWYVVPAAETITMIIALTLTKSNDTITTQ